MAGRKPKKVGKRHPFLMYKRTMDRTWGITLLLGMLLLAVWWFGRSYTQFFRFSIENVILFGAIISLAIGIFAFFARFMCYVQAKQDHLLIATPFVRLKTSYRRVVEIRSIEFYRLYSPKNLSWSERTYLDPLFARTAVVVNLKSFPVSRLVLRLFFPKYLLSPQHRGFILVVPDWMTLSTELDSRYSAWRSARSRPRHTRNFMWERGGKR